MHTPNSPDQPHVPFALTAHHQYSARVLSKLAHLLFSWLNRIQYLYHPMTFTSASLSLPRCLNVQRSPIIVSAEHYSPRVKINTTHQTSAKTTANPSPNPKHWSAHPSSTRRKQNTFFKYNYNRVVSSFVSSCCKSEVYLMMAHGDCLFWMNAAEN